jgi:hypothetical protein
LFIRFYAVEKSTEKEIEAGAREKAADKPLTMPTHISKLQA